MKFSTTTSILVATVMLAACEGSDAAPAATVARPSPVAIVQQEPTTTTQSSSSSTSTSTSSSTTAVTSTTAATTTTTIPADPVMPLTGLPVEDPAIAARPAVVVKISNDPGARPQSGLDSADIVFEAWGAGPTRFAAIFQSKDAPNVGPIRSARTQDVDLVGSFNGAVFACSGGNARAVAAIRSSDLLVVTEGQGPGWRLDKHRHRPHATFNDTASLRLNADPSRPGPAQQLHYRPAGVAATGDASAGFDLHIEQVRVQWRFVPESNRYERSQDGGPHVLADGTRVRFDNVVVLWIDYDHSPADPRSPDGGTIGSGDAVVFTNGKAISARWSRDDRLQPIALVDAAGSPVLLTPGTTLFELANTGNGSFPGTDELMCCPPERCRNAGDGCAVSHSATTSAVHLRTEQQCQVLATSARPAARTTPQLEERSALLRDIVRHTKTTTFLFAALVLGACSSSDGSTAATTIASTVPSTEPAATSSPATTAAATSTTVQSTTSSTTIPAEPVMPLLGTAITDPALAARPALVVKIDNHPEARPQSGLNQADIVYEENVEQLTRFAAVFQSQNPDPVGPIRSGRTQDVELLGSLNKPIFAWSGGNPGVTAAINGSDFVVANVQSNARKESQSYRSRDRGAPHNLYAQGSGLFTMAPEGAAPPPQQFVYRKEGEAAAGVPSAGADLAMDGVSVSWKFDAPSGSYLRFQSGKAHNDAALGQVNSANVVVLVVEYVPSPVDRKSPEAQTTGTGEAFVFTGGNVVHGTWTRGDRLVPFQLTADDGTPILLTPGRTWIELARADSTTMLPG